MAQRLLYHCYVIQYQICLNRCAIGPPELTITARNRGRNCRIAFRNAVRSIADSQIYLDKFDIVLRNNDKANIEPLIKQDLFI